MPPGKAFNTALSYNQAAQLSAVNDGTQVVASYTYNGFGQRVLKAFPGGTGEIYQYGQNGMLLEETDQAWMNWRFWVRNSLTRW